MKSRAINNVFTTVVKLIVVICCLLMLTISSYAEAESYEPLENIRETAIEFAKDKFNVSSFNNVNINTDNLDPRLKLPTCSMPLTAIPANNSNNATRFIIGVQCQGAKPWKVYVPVNIDATVKVITSISNLPRGSILSESDVYYSEQSIQQLPQGYVNNINKINGMELTRQINPDSVITSNMIRPRQLVKRGQEVTIIASGDHFEIRMNGKAKANGAKGEWIPIENRTSGRNIEAMVVSEQLVKVKM